MPLPVCKYCGSNAILELEDACICRKIIGIDDDGTALLEAQEQIRAQGGVVYECMSCWRTLTDFTEILPASAVPMPSMTTEVAA